MICRTRQGVTEEEAIGGTTSEYPQIPFSSPSPCSSPLSFSSIVVFSSNSPLVLGAGPLFILSLQASPFEGIGDASHPLELRSAPRVGLTLSSNSLCLFIVDPVPAIQTLLLRFVLLLIKPSDRLNYVSISISRVTNTLRFAYTWRDCECLRLIRGFSLPVAGY